MNLWALQDEARARVRELEQLNWLDQQPQTDFEHIIAAISENFVSRIFSRGKVCKILSTTKGECTIALTELDQGKRLQLDLGIVVPGVEQQSYTLGVQEYQDLRMKPSALRAKILLIATKLFEALPTKEQQQEANEAEAANRVLGRLLALVPALGRCKS